MSEKGLQILEKKKSIPFAKGTLLNPYDYCHLESNIEFHLAAKLPRS